MPICTRCGSHNVEGAQFCGNCGAPVSAVPISNSPVSANPACKVCDRGTLMRRKMRRLSGPAVAIGYILLIPSILGMAACAIMLLFILIVGIAAVAHGSTFGTAIAGSSFLVFVYIGVTCFIFGLVGWLLIMKKHVLQCIYCGAVVDAAAPIASQPNQSRVSARNIILGVLIILGISIAIWAFNEAGTQTSTPTATTAESAQPTRDNSTSAPARSDTMQPFTSADARFSVLFPGTPTQSSQPLHMTDGETVTLYLFSVTAENGNTSYAVKYINYPPDYVNAYPAEDAVSDPQVRLQAVEKGAAAGKTLFRDDTADLNGVPGRRYAIMLRDGSSCTVHEYLTGNRLYQLYACSAKDYVPNDQGYQFLHSFRILDNPTQP